MEHTRPNYIVVPSWLAVALTSLLGLVVASALVALGFVVTAHISQGSQPQVSIASQIEELEGTDWATLYPNVSSIEVMVSDDDLGWVLMMKATGDTSTAFMSSSWQSSGDKIVLSDSTGMTMGEAIEHHRERLDIPPQTSWGQPHTLYERDESTPA